MRYRRFADWSIICVRMLQLRSTLLRTAQAMSALVVGIALAACTSAPPLPGDATTRSPQRPSYGAEASPPTATGAPSRILTDAPADGPPTWAVVADRDLLTSQGEIRDVLAGGPGLIAVGSGTNGTEGGRAAIWTSPDGEDWDLVTLEGRAARGRLTSVTAGPAGFVAVGGECCPDRAAVWTSQDGLAWQRVGDQGSFDGAVMTSTTAWAGGLVAVGCVVDLECTGTAVWTSSNGTDWSRVALGRDIGAAYLGDITASGEVLVAVGTTDRDQPGPPAIFVSLDAQTWTRADVPSVPMALSSVTAGTDGIVAVGRSLDELTGLPVSLVLTSPDGAAWTTVTSDKFARADVEDILVGPAGYVMSGRLKRGEAGIAAAWHSPDGRTWSRVVPGPEGAMRAVAVAPDGRLVAVGHVTEDERSMPGVWISPAE